MTVILDPESAIGWPFLKRADFSVLNNIKTITSSSETWTSDRLRTLEDYWWRNRPILRGPSGWLGFLSPPPTSDQLMPIRWPPPVARARQQLGPCPPKSAATRLLTWKRTCSHWPVAPGPHLLEEPAMETATKPGSPIVHTQRWSAWPWMTASVVPFPWAPSTNFLSECCNRSVWRGVGLSRGRTRSSLLKLIITNNFLHPQRRVPLLQGCYQSWQNCLEGSF